MAKIRIGSTDLYVEKNGFGCLPIQRIGKSDAVFLLHRAYDGGMTFFDTARFYTDSEEKLGAAFSGMRDKVVIASKSMAKTGDMLLKELDTSLTKLKTDYIDLYQFHNPAFCPQEDGQDGLYAAAMQAKKQGKIRHLGITNHRLHVAQQALDCGLYESVQYPFSYLATADERALVDACKEKNVGFISMKGMAGGAISNGRAAFAFQQSVENAIPIWGVQHQWELDEFLDCIKHPPAMDAAMQEVIAADKAALSGDFCRSCGYCMPCPQGIEISLCARMTLMLRRAPVAEYTTPEMQAKMEHAATCTQCGACKVKCPYGLDTPSLIAQNVKEYREILATLDT